MTNINNQPDCKIHLMQPITIEVKLNGVICYVLVDTGCNTNSLSPVTARIVNADKIELDEQVNLQLGTKGSRTKINYGTRVNLKVGPVNERTYFDMVDIDRYDAILGTPFLTEHKVAMDFGQRTMAIDGVDIPVYTEMEEAEVRKRHADRRRHTIEQYAMELEPEDTTD